LDIAFQAVDFVGEFGSSSVDLNVFPEFFDLFFKLFDFPVFTGAAKSTLIFQLFFQNIGLLV
jgi:hypothetical protein